MLDDGILNFEFKFFLIIYLTSRMKPNIPVNENNRWQKDKLLVLLHNYWLKKTENKTQTQTLTAKK